ncbi:MAG: hypothetical protein HFH09_05070 [Bacilli bacterium]|nr:hypothetical protein [Bacilli bacterium]
MLNFQKNNHLMAWLKNKKIRLCAGVAATVVLIGGYTVKSGTLIESETESLNLTIHYEELAESVEYTEEPIVFSSSRTSVHSDEASYVQILQFYQKDPAAYRYKNLQGKEFIVIIDGEQLHFVYQVEEGWVGAHSENDKNEFEVMIMPLSKYIVANGYEDAISKDMNLEEIENIINSGHMKNSESSRKIL